MLRVLLEPKTTNLFTGYGENLQSTVLWESVFDALAHGATVCALTDMSSELNVIYGAARIYLQNHERENTHIKRLHGIHNYRLLNTVEKLEAALMDAVGDVPTIMVLDLGRDMKAVEPPGTHFMALAAELPKLFPATVAIAAHYGPSGPPKPALEKYNAGRVWDCTELNAHLLKVTPVKPFTGNSMQFAVKTMHGGALILEPMECVNVVR